MDSLLLALALTFLAAPLARALTFLASPVPATLGRTRLINLVHRSYPHRRAIHQTVGTIHYHLVAILQAALNIGDLVCRDTYLHGLQMHFGVFVDDVNERALLAILHGHRRYHKLIGKRINKQPDIYELLREKRVVLVVEDG